MRIKKGDKVIVLSGKDKGQTGKVLKVLPKEGRVIVEQVNMATKHVKPQGPTQQGGLVKQERPLDVSKVAYYCDKDEQGVRIGYKFLEDGSKVRVCKKCGETLNS